MIEQAKLVQMVQAEVAADKWWTSLTEKEQKAYVKAHPKSKYARGGKAMGKPSKKRMKLSQLNASPQHHAWVKQASRLARRYGKAADDHSKWNSSAGSYGDAEKDAWHARRTADAFDKFKHFVRSGPPHALPKKGASAKHVRLAKQQSEVAAGMLDGAAHERDADMTPMYAGDAVDHHRIAHLIHHGRDRAAARKASGIDTASRDEVDDDVWNHLHPREDDDF